MQISNYHFEHMLKFCPITMAHTFTVTVIKCPQGIEFIFLPKTFIIISYSSQHESSIAPSVYRVKTTYYIYLTSYI